MSERDGVQALALNLRLLGERSRKNVLVSAGSLSDKERLLPTIRKLRDELGATLYATPGTNRFLKERGVPNHEIHKIADKIEPNIMSFLAADSLDLVINVLTGDRDYDEKLSDSNRIRLLSVQNGIPLITDPDVAIATVEDAIDKQSQDLYRYKVKDESKPWDLKSSFLQYVKRFGGFACYHAHFDKAYLISPQLLEASHSRMQEKWKMFRTLKEKYTEEDLYERIERCVQTMIANEVTYCRTMVDADSIVELRALDAAIRVRDDYRHQINLEIGVQPLEGVCDSTTRKFFFSACEKADFVGGLPSRDRPTRPNPEQSPERHLDYIMTIAKELNKRLDVHVDQENKPGENETELLAWQTMKHGLEGRVSAVHAISLAAQPEEEQERIIHLLEEAGVSVIVCPSAAISMKQLIRYSAPIHNSIAPVPKLLEARIPVYLGVDNIHDLFMPFVDGDIWFECRLLMEACRYYEIEKVARMACDKSGFAPAARRAGT